MVDIRIRSDVLVTAPEQTLACLVLPTEALNIPSTEPPLIIFIRKH